MAKFLFKMETVLKLRESIEEQKKNEFGKAAAELERQREKLKEIKQEQKRMIQEFHDMVKKHIDSKKSDQYNKYIKLLDKRIEEQKAVVKKCEAIEEACRKELVEATKEKKKLEKLREKQYQQYLIEEKREEQKVTDELVSYQTFIKGS